LNQGKTKFFVFKLINQKNGKEHATWQEFYLGNLPEFFLLMLQYSKFYNEAI